MTVTLAYSVSVSLIYEPIDSKEEVRNKGKDLKKREEIEKIFTILGITFTILALIGQVGAAAATMTNSARSL
jgi:hypothetical protein